MKSRINVNAVITFEDYKQQVIKGIEKEYNNNVPFLIEISEIERCYNHNEDIQEAIDSTIEESMAWDFNCL
jgi:hypothetical protein